MLWSPTIRATLLAWNAVARRVPPGMWHEPAINLRPIHRHPLGSVGALVLGLRCSWCPGSAPMPKLLGLYALPPVTVARARS
jgi:hypothetical protein